MDPTGPLPDPLNFPLLRMRAKTKFTAAIMGDTQVYTEQEIGYCRDSYIEELADTKAAFVLAMGDNIGDDLSLYPRYLDVMKGVGVPVYLVPGNHDLNFDALDDEHSFDTFKREFGPTYYSFNYGKVHFVVLDSVIYPSLQFPESYHGEISADQMEWLENDLAFVPKNHLVVLNMHIPVVSWVDSASTKHQVANRQDLYDLLKGRNVVTLGGHTHTIEHFLPGEELPGWGQPTPIDQIIVGAACGSWWTGDLDEDGVPMAYQRCGAPRGFMAFDFNNTSYVDRFKATGMAKEKQMGLSFLTDSFNTWYADVTAGLATLNDLPDQGILSTADLYTAKLVANVWNGSIGSVVTCQFDGRKPITAVKSMDTPDPYALRLESYVFRFVDGLSIWGQWFNPGKAQPLDAWLHTTASCHLWTCELPKDLLPGVHTATVRTTDIHGNYYEEKISFEVVN
jgi:hypothetical protein